MTSGAIEKGVPTQVVRFVIVSVICSATPKSSSFTFPLSLNSTFAAADASEQKERGRGAMGEEE